MVPAKDKDPQIPRRRRQIRGSAAAPAVLSSLSSGGEGPSPLTPVPHGTTGKEAASMLHRIMAYLDALAAVRYHELAHDLAR